MQDNQRNDILMRISGSLTDPHSFNYDMLSCPPIHYFFSDQDIYQLHKIASSLRYAGNPKKKYQEIDKIMSNRGFRKFVSGTNRMSYECIENRSFIAKVAMDDVGLSDNPKEYKNQFILKPFCTKVFEVSPCGTLGFFERVNPITSELELGEGKDSLREDIRLIIKNNIVPFYLMEDIGFKFFMNWGLREGFGPVLLDFPYMYELDSNKIYCNAPSKDSISGCCDGKIQYDPDFNYLYCSKCGVRYRAPELSKALKENKVIVKGKGESKMRIRISGGTHNVNKKIEVGNYYGQSMAFPRKPINKSGKPNKKYNNTTTNTERGTHKMKVRTFYDDEFNNFNTMDDGIIRPKKKNKKPKESEVVEKQPLEEKTISVAKEKDKTLLSNSKTENTDSTSSIDKVSKDDVEDCIFFDDTLKEKYSKKSLEDEFEEVSRIEELKGHLEEAINIIKEISDNDDISETNEMYGLLELFFTDENIKDTIEMMGDEEDMKYVSEFKERHEILELLSKDNDKSSSDIYRDLIKVITKLVEEDLSDRHFYDLTGYTFIKYILTNAMKYDFYMTDTISDIVISKDDNKIVLIESDPKIRTTHNEGNDKEGDVVYECDEVISNDYPLDSLHDILSSTEYYDTIETDEDTEIDSSEPEEYKGFHYVSAKIINVKDIFQKMPLNRVIVRVDNDGNYECTKDGKIIAIDGIDDRAVNETSMVPKTWLNGVLKELKELKEDSDESEDVEVINEKDIVVEDDINKVRTGMVPPNNDLSNYSVNGVMEEEE